jgi:glycerophosphoryl diester phosphodiesterase
MADGKDETPGQWRLSRAIWRRVWTVQSLVMLVALAVTLPIASAYLNVAVRGSDQATLVDLDVLGALFSPSGLVVLFIIGLLWLTIQVLGHTAQLIIAHETLHQREISVPASLRHMASHAKGLLLLVLRFALQSTALASPFLLLSAGILYLQLGQRELNHYLATRPPEFVLALTLVGLLLAGMIFALIRHLVDWLLALPLLLFHNESPAEARRRSRQLAGGHRARLFLQLTSWVAIPPLLILAVGVTLISPLIRFSEMMDHRIGLTSLVVVIAIALCAALGFLARLIGASFFAAYHARLGLRTGLDAGETEIPDEAPDRIPWAVACASILVIGITIVASFSWLEDLRKDPPVAVIAHRGASQDAPENTLAAIEAAIDAGADLVEIDVQQHPSGELYLFHDRDLRRIAKEPRRLREMDPKSIEQIDAGGWGDWATSEFKGERIPTLKQALEACRGRIEVMIELKSYGPKDPMAKAVIAAVEEAGMASSVRIMSFDLELARLLNDTKPDWQVGFVTSAPPELAELREFDFLAVGMGVLSRDLTRRAGQTGMEIYAWTLNDGIDLSSAASRGVAGLITDRPTTAIRVLGERSRLNPAERLTLDLLSRIAMIRKLLRS